MTDSTDIAIIGAGIFGLATAHALCRDGAGRVTLLDRGLHPIATLVRRSTLEDVFLRLTGRSLAD